MHSEKEHILQKTCVRWFRLAYPQFWRLLYAVPNGGQRNAVVAAKLKAEGVMMGAPDLKLDIPRHGHGSLAIEMKVGRNRQTPDQKEWQADFEAVGNRYVVCRTLEEFITEITNYLKN